MPSPSFRRAGVAHAEAMFAAALLTLAAVLAVSAISTKAAAQGNTQGATSAAVQTSADPAPLAITEIAPGVHVHTGLIEDWLPSNGGDVANLGFIVGSRCVAVIDTGGTPEIGRRWRAAIERATKLPVCYVFNTHAHPDHVLGNAAFARPGARFVAAAKFDAAIAAREPYYRRALERDFGIVMPRDAVIHPTIAVGDTQEFDLGDRVIVARAWPTAHTDNDLTVYDHNTRTLFASDLLFVQHMPVVDGKLVGWLRALPELARIDAALIVPGHGPTTRGGPDAWRPEQEYLESLQRETRAAIKSGRTLSQAVDSVSLEAATRWQLADRYHRRNVTAAYAELEWED